MVRDVGNCKVQRTLIAAPPVAKPIVGAPGHLRLAFRVRQGWLDAGALAALRPRTEAKWRPVHAGNVAMPAKCTGIGAVYIPKQQAAAQSQGAICLNVLRRYIPRFSAARGRGSVG